MSKTIDNDEAKKLADEHIEWFLSTLRPLLHSHFIHGFKHGVDYKIVKNLNGLDEPKEV